MDFEKTRSQNTSILREYKKVHAELKKLKEGMNSENFQFANNTFNRSHESWPIMRLQAQNACSDYIVYSMIHII